MVSQGLAALDEQGNSTSICACPEPLCMLVLEVEEDVLAHSLFKGGSSHSPMCMLALCVDRKEAGASGLLHGGTVPHIRIHLPAALPMLAQSSREDASALQHVAAEHGPLSAPHLNHHIANHVLVGVVLWEQELLRSREVMPRQRFQGGGQSTGTAAETCRPCCEHPDLQCSATCSYSKLVQGGLYRSSARWRRAEAHALLGAARTGREGV